MDGMRWVAKSVITVPPGMIDVWIVLDGDETEPAGPFKMLALSHEATEMIIDGEEPQRGMDIEQPFPMGYQVTDQYLSPEYQSPWVLLAVDWPEPWQPWIDIAFSYAAAMQSMVERRAKTAQRPS